MKKIIVLKIMMILISIQNLSFSMDFVSPPLSFQIASMEEWKGHVDVFFLSSEISKNPTEKIDLYKEQYKELMEEKRLMACLYNFLSGTAICVGGLASFYSFLCKDDPEIGGVAQLLLEKIGIMGDVSICIVLFDYFVMKPRAEKNNPVCIDFLKKKLCKDFHNELQEKGYFNSSLSFSPDVLQIEEMKIYSREKITTFLNFQNLNKNI